MVCSMSLMRCFTATGAALAPQNPRNPNPKPPLRPLPMTTDRLLLRHTPAAAALRSLIRPQQLHLSPAAGRAVTRRRAAAASCSGSAGEDAMTYKGAGVDIDAGAELVRRIAQRAPWIGGFGGLFPFGDHYLMAGTDGVGTKLKLAFETGIHDTIGIDLVAMSVNDIVTSGAKPLFFLDYYATSRLDVDIAEKVLKGIVDGCEQSDCVLLGGETAEMPDFYAESEYDLCGFAVGAVKKDKVIDGKNIEDGDILIGLPSSGVHSNGFSLVRRVVAKSGLSLSDQLPRNDVITTTIGEALMAPTIIYVKQVLEIISDGGVKGIAHITGGGFTDNIPRVFPSGLGAKIFTGSWEVPPVFKWIQQVGKIEDVEMRRTFNMGIGMVLVAFGGLRGWKNSQFSKSIKFPRPFFHHSAFQHRKQLMEMFKMAVFATDLHSRTFLCLPKTVGVDFRTLRGQTFQWCPKCVRI